jgi:hypothetical protein
MKRISLPHSRQGGWFVLLDMVMFASNWIHLINRIGAIECVDDRQGRPRWRQIVDSEFSRAVRRPRVQRVHRQEPQIGTSWLGHAVFRLTSPWHLEIFHAASTHAILRFKAFERVVHWLTALSFVILGLTVSNITFGKTVLLPIIGLDAFAKASQAAKYVHDFTSFSFVTGLIIIIIIIFL